MAYVTVLWSVCSSTELRNRCMECKCLDLNPRMEESLLRKLIAIPVTTTCMHCVDVGGAVEVVVCTGLGMLDKVLIL